ncbi:ERG2 and sigma1 receptor like protein domain-containing protein [Ditylenchus destructor]|uniref:Sigma non-opioid intracellular receptor 1 n=1 Tax=Ditylenchus destructor TaxID=166010 RepID=A0AAD4NDR9_9BILA|nr:ERG2 and sigma1 receptor like protein domain-containing protein [Ditylenchus destructor]
MAFFFTKFFRNIILIAVLFNAINFYLKWKSYNISAKDFKTAAANSANENALSAISKLTSDLRRVYKEKVPYDLYWIPLSAGGLQLRAQFLYADWTEYIAILAAGGNTVGRSGFHWSNNTCTVLTGQLVRYSDALNGIVKESFTKGQNFRHGQFESYIYEFTEGTHVACYGRGFVPASALWTTTGAISNGDPLAVAKVFYVYGKTVFENTFSWVTQLFHHYKDKATKFEL